MAHALPPSKTVDQINEINWFLVNMERNQPTNATNAEKCAYIIECVEKVLKQYQEKNYITTHADVQLVFQILIQREVIHNPNRNPVFNLRSSYRGNLGPIQEIVYDPIDCLYCKVSLGLPVEVYSSHCLSSEGSCPLFPFHNMFIVNFQDVVRAILELLCKMNTFEYCLNCYQQGKSEEMYQSHVYKLTTGEVMCPFALDLNDLSIDFKQET